MGQWPWGAQLVISIGRWFVSFVRVVPYNENTGIPIFFSKIPFTLNVPIFII